MKSAHLKGGKGQRPNSNKLDGKKSENDAYFMYNMAILVGCPCEVTIRDGRKYDGIFSAYAADRHELLIEAAHRVTDENNDEAPITEHYDVLVVPTDKMLSTRFKNVDTTYATRDFVTDQAIASNRNMSLKDKELTPWDGPDGGSDDEISLDTGGLSSSKENGWEAKDMFKKNEEKYGVTTSYKHDLAGYTTQLDKSDPDSFKRHEQQASQVAQEIEKNTVSWERGELENGEDEEEAFSAVVRPQRNSAGHSNINNNNNNNNNTSSSNTGDKYIPPSRRQSNVQPSAQSMPQNQPMNNNGASQMNNNSGNPRKQMYSQNQNPRGGYNNVPQNNMYHDRRNNYDNRRAPPPNQYPNPNTHANTHTDNRRMDDGRQQRVPNKPLDRRTGGRDDPSKLKEFSSTFRLQTSQEQQNQPRRMPNNQNPQHSSSAATIVNSNSANVNMSAPGRNPSPPSTAATKTAKDENSTPVSSTQQQNNVDTPDKVSPSIGAVHAGSANTSAGGSSNLLNSPSMNEGTPVSGSSDNQTPGSADSKGSSDSDKKKFTFNPNAKEFNPSAKSFSSRSPSTPPRPPSTPAQANTPQIMPTQQIHSFMPIPMPMLYAQPYPQTAALTPSSNSSASSAGTTPRHGGHRKGGSMLGVPPRSEMTPPIQMTTGPPLLAPASIQAAAAPHQYAFVPQGHYSQVMRVGVVPQTVMPVFPSEGNNGSQMHQQVHYIQHNGAPSQNAGNHPNNNTPSNNPNSQTSVVPSNGQAYNQAGGSHGGAPHVGYPFVGVPVMNVGYPHGPHHMITVPYVPHSHQGEYPQGLLMCHYGQPQSMMNC